MRSICWPCAWLVQTVNGTAIGTAQALTCYGGAPLLIVPDNPCTLVPKGDLYEPVLTDTVRAS